VLLGVNIPVDTVGINGLIGRVITIDTWGSTKMKCFHCKSENLNGYRRGFFVYLFCEDCRNLTYIHVFDWKKVIENEDTSNIKDISEEMAARVETS